MWPSIAGHDRALRRAQRDRVAQRSRGKPGLHPRVNGGPDDLVGVAVLDRAQIELALTRGVLRNIGEPDPVRAGRCPDKVVSHPALLLDGREQVVMDSRPRLAGLAPATVMRDEDARGRAQSPHPVLRGHDAPISELVGDEPVAQRRVVLVDLVDHVDDMRVVPVPLGHGVFKPLVVLPGSRTPRPCTPPRPAP